ncbi:MAG: CRISPR-associated protein Cas4 [Christensenellaceae bacterium]
MKSEFDDLERIPISAIKQYVYCKRRFALMFVDGEWGTNYKIVEGELLHSKVDDPFFNEKRGDIHISRSVPVFSKALNVYGIADLVEFIKADDGVRIKGKEGKWKINPIEYKNGKPEKSKAPNYQIGLVAMCLEEMLNTKIDTADVFYKRIRRRVKIDMTEELRSDIQTKLREMMAIMRTDSLPPMPENQICKLCSLADICLHDIFKTNSINRVAIAGLLKKELL